MPPFKDDDSLVEWVKRNVGRKAKWRAGTENGEGRIIGYQVSTIGPGRVIFDNHIHAYRGDPSNKDVFLIESKQYLDTDKKHGGYAWIMPQWITEFLTPVSAQRVVKKTISEYPHECPRCHGPAYIGFNVRAECQAKCPT